MKSNPSCFNATVFKKNLTRFAPSWGLYTVCALMGLMLLMMDSGARWMTSDLLGSLTVLSLISSGYAMLCAQLLFGDLYNSRMCNALHAMPMKRETWFVTNVASGLAFHLIPTGIMAILSALVLMVYCPAEHIWAAPIWFAGVNLQFLCFFGIAVFCAFCVGSRFAQAVIYGIVNFGAAIAAWLLDTLYIPRFYGIELNFEPFSYFCPIAKMVNDTFVRAVRYFEEDTMEVRMDVTYQIGDGFAYYFIVAAVGIGLLLLAMQLYRRRNLECAGDFMAVRGLEPVFLVVYTLIIGAAFYFFTDAMVGMESLLFLFLGLAVGWFTGKMLLERTPRVFRKRNILGCGTLMLAFGLTLAVAAMDPFGIVFWVPEKDEVESVGISTGWYSPMNVYDEVSVTDPENIQKIIDLHQEALDFYETHGTAQFHTESVTTEVYPDKTDSGQMNFSLQMSLNYYMKNGRVTSRYYNIWMGDDTGEYLRRLFSRPEAVFGSGMTEERFLEENGLLVIQDCWDGQEIYIHDTQQIRELYRAMIADCEAGTMAQQWDFHHPDQNLFWINRSEGEAITIFSNGENTLNWLREYGVDVDALIEKMKY